MVSLSQEQQEPLLPTVLGEKGLIEHDKVQPIAFVTSTPRSNKVDTFKKLLAAIALMIMGASLLKITQNHSLHHHHRHSYDGFGFFSHDEASKKLDDSGSHRTGPHGPPDHHHGHGPHFHGPISRPVECFALKSEAVYFNLTLQYPGQSLFLHPSLSDAKIDIKQKPHSNHSAEVALEGRSSQESLSPPPHGGPDGHRRPTPPGPPPPHGGPHGGPHDGPPPPPGAPHHGPPRGPPHGPPHRGPDGHGPHGKPSTVLVRVESIADNITKKGNETYVCSLDLPFGISGLGLFHGKPELHKGKKEHHKDHALEEEKKGKKKHMKPEPFEPVSVKLTFPAGPFTVTSCFPGPPHPHGPSHHGPFRHHSRHPKLQGGIRSWFGFLKSKKPCNRSMKPQTVVPA